LSAQFSLGFFIDHLGDAPLDLPRGNRVLYVVDGKIDLGDTTLGPDEAWQGGAPVRVTSPAGATVWRWELSTADQVKGALLAGPIDHLTPEDGWLMRCDSVSFPPGGCAHTHVHQGPGIRCLREGSIEIDSEGMKTLYAPGEPWFEAGPDPVFAQADADVPSRFIRVMILPRALLGKKSLAYVRDEDRDKPKVQTYRLYVDTPIEV